MEIILVKNTKTGEYLRRKPKGRGYYKFWTNDVNRARTFSKKHYAQSCINENNLQSIAVVITLSCIVS